MLIASSIAIIKLDSGISNDGFQTPVGSLPNGAPYIYIYIYIEREREI